TYYSVLGTAQVLKWAPLYDYATVYGNPARITTTLSNFPYSGDTKSTAYRQYYDGGDTPSSEHINDDTKWKYYYCGIKFVESPTYTECLKQH
ncbi:MAG TPA: hypothetical protein VKR58_09095, partial [Aquella sp.]|nr:hypothetical protein [Aquella sp.]